VKILKVDVVMCTWNSNKPYFVECLSSIRREIPIHHFILIDRFSNDGTVEAVKKIFPEAVVRETYANLGAARKIGIDLVDTEFFVFVDSDIELCKGWFREIEKHVDSNTGAVHGQAMPVLKHLAKWFEWTWKKWIPLRRGNIDKVQIATAKEPDVLRGCTHNTLVRKSAVTNWTPPAFLCAYEDHMLLRHVVKNGYVWKVVTDLTVKHWGVLSLKEGLRKAKWGIAGARLIGYDSLSLWSLMKALPKGTLKALIASLEIKEPLIIPYIFLYQLEYIQGWVGWAKYLVLKR